MKKAITYGSIVLTTFLTSCGSSAEKKTKELQQVQSPEVQSLKTITAMETNGDTITVGQDRYLKTEYGRYGLYQDNSGDVIVNEIVDRARAELSYNAHNDGVFDLSLSAGDKIDSDTKAYYVNGGSYDRRLRVRAFRVAPLQ